MKWLGHFLALFVMVVWGTTFVNSKVLLTNGLMPDEIFLLRFILAYVILALICHKKWLADSWKDELTFAALGLTGGSLYFLAENSALLYSTSSNVSILVGSTPMLTALLVGTVYKSERLNVMQGIGSVIAFIGMTLIVLNDQLVLHLNPLGDTLALCAAVTWAFYSLMMRWVSGQYGTIFITRKIFFYGLITVLPFIYISGNTPQWDKLSNPLIAGNLLFLGLVASTACYLLWNKVLKMIGTVRATNYIYMQSFVTMIVASIVLKERITLMAIIGVCVLVLGLMLVQKKKNN